MNLDKNWKDKIMNEYLEWRKAEGIPSLPNYVPDERTKEEKQRQWSNNYYEKNEEEILKKAKVKITCEVCGSTFRRDGKAEHLKTKKHREATT